MKLTAYEAARRSPQEPAGNEVPERHRISGADSEAYADVVELLDRLQAGGVEVALDGDGLAVTPWPAVGEDDRDALRDLRDRVVEYLAGEREEIGPARHFGSWGGQTAASLGKIPSEHEAEAKEPVEKEDPAALRASLRGRRRGERMSATGRAAYDGSFERFEREAKAAKETFNRRIKK